MTAKDIGRACENAIPRVTSGARVTSFNMRSLMAQLRAMSDISIVLPGLTGFQGSLGSKVGKHVEESIVRIAFFIEPVVLPAATTTRYKTRWGIDAPDPRFADVGECLEVARVLIEGVQSMAGTTDGKATLDGLAKHKMVSYELPFDYVATSNPIHRAANIHPVDSELSREVAGLRTLLLNKTTPQVEVFVEAYKKIRTKTYLTDRVLTGAHKTNREKRWEAHPESVHFALRDECMRIEAKLITAMCYFEGFPKDVFSLLEQKSLLLPQTDVTKCPVTLMPLSFPDFAAELTSPTHGRSSFQVGHLDPLKLGGNTYNGGHAASNIGWISEEGNRIQGSLSLNDTQAMLKRIWVEYGKAHLLGE